MKNKYVIVALIVAAFVFLFWKNKKDKETTTSVEETLPGINEDTDTGYRVGSGAGYVAPVSNSSTPVVSVVPTATTYYAPDLGMPMRSPIEKIKGVIVPKINTLSTGIGGIAVLNAAVVPKTNTLSTTGGVSVSMPVTAHLPIGVTLKGKQLQGGVAFTLPKKVSL